MKNVILAFSFILISTIGFAQTDSHTRAAVELTELMNMEQRMDEMVDRIVELQVESNPAVASYKDVFLDFFHKYMNWNRVKDDFITLYKEYYTEKEIREITEFYKTETGQKVARLMPELFSRGGKIGQNIAMEHQEELMQNLQKAIESKGEEVYEMEEIEQ